ANKPDPAAGSTIVTSACQRVAPSANAACVCAAGTSASASSATVNTSGSAASPSAKPTSIAFQGLSGWISAIACRPASHVAATTTASSTGSSESASQAAVRRRAPNTKPAESSRQGTATISASTVATCCFNHGARAAVATRPSTTVGTAANSSN